MDRAELAHKALDLVKKYRWSVLVVLLGVALMFLPNADKSKSYQAPLPAETKTGMDEELAHILSQIQGAGEVRVMLTEASGAQTVYQTDLDESSGSGQTRREETVIISDADRTQSGLVQQVLPPKYQGAIIVCTGADNASVRLAIVEAVANVTGLGADRICVLKMK